MAELSLETITQAVSGFNKNVLKIRKYIRDNQASLTAYSTNQLNKALREYLPTGMQLKRNYGHLALRSVGGRGAVKDEEPEETPVETKKVCRKQKEEVEYEYEYEEDDRPPQRGYQQPPPQQYYQQPVNYNMMSNADLARQCFMPAMARYRNRTW